MSKTLEVLKSSVTKARNLTYYGKYRDAVFEFDKVVDKIESTIYTITDRVLISQWKKCLEEIKYERDVADSFKEVLSANFETYERLKRAKTEKTDKPNRDQGVSQRVLNLKSPSDQELPTKFKQQSFTTDDQSPSEINRKHFPFGKEPFKRGSLHQEDDTSIKKQGKKKQEQEEEKERAFEEREAEIWPKKKPVPARKTTVPTKSTTTKNVPNNSSVDPKGKDYDRPWKANTKKKEAGEEKKSYLKFCYPDGQGPDANLIEMLERQVLTKNITTTFEDIAELTQAKEALKEAVLLPLQFPSLFTGIRRAWKGVLLFGPPGTGKTLLAKAIAASGKTTFFNLTASSLASKWKGQSEKLVRILFEMARFYGPSTIFFDQVDSLASKRGDKQDESSRKVKTELMAQIDGASGNEGDPKIVIIGATNRPWDLDDAIRRRFQKRIYIPLPTEIGRQAMLRIHLKSFNIDEIDIKYIMNKTEGFSGADMKILCSEAAYEPLRIIFKREGACIDADEQKRREMEKEANQPFKMEYFHEALKKSKPSVGKSDLECYEKWTEQFGERGSN